jgi:S-DNA-T family DNA segregation ATPase FtsK/SpoIIIE
MLVKKLQDFNLPVRPLSQNAVELGPAFARLKIEPSGRTGIRQLRNRADDLKVFLNLETSPLINTQAGYISVDVQLPQRQVLRLPAKDQTEPDGRPICPLGQDVQGKLHLLDLSDPGNCHLLVAGVTGSGKSEFLKVMLAGMARRLAPTELEFVLIDPKRVTFNFGRSPYIPKGIAHSVDDALPLVEWCVEEMERRYELLEKRRIENVDQLKGSDARPRVVLIFDEFADLMADREAKKSLEQALKRLATKARAAGIHLVLATQRPDKDVVTPQVRSNLPGRVALKVSSELDSKLILGAVDAAYLLGKGDLLWQRGGGLLRLQCPLVQREELEADLRI